MDTRLRSTRQQLAERGRYGWSGRSAAVHLPAGAAAALVAIAVAGCSVQATEPPKPPAPATVELPSEAARASRELPAPLESLALSEAQRGQLLTLRAELESSLEPVADAARELALAVAKAARRCNAEAAVVESASSWMVRTADEAWPSVLDAIDRLHAILTPAQRRALADRLLGGEQASQSAEPTDEGARAFGDTLDLSVGQLFKLLTRALALRSEFEARIEPWREHARSALVAFRQADFAVRDHAIAEVPAARLGAQLLGEALRTIFPILEPPQCVALADLIEREVQDQERAERAKRSSAGRRDGE